MLRACFVVILCFATASFADAVNISVSSGVAMGKGQPSVNVQILEPIAGFILNLKRSDGKDVEIRGGGKVGLTGGRYSGPQVIAIGDRPFAFVPPRGRIPLTSFNVSS